MILPVAQSARQGAKLLGDIIEQKGAGEGFGVAFIDSKEIWYLETGSGHQWLAVRLPADSYFVSANQGRLRHYDPNDNANYMASPTLVSFAKKQGLYDPARGEFDFHQAYSRDNKTIPPIIIRASGRYNTSLIRIWIRSLAKGKHFLFLTPITKISVAAVKTRYAITIRERRTTLMPVIIHKNHGDRYPFFVPRSHIFYRSDRNYRRLSAT